MAAAMESVRYEPMSLARLADLLRAEPRPRVRWRLLLEFCKEYAREPADGRQRLLEQEPPSVGDEPWDVMLAALAEHVAAKDGRAAPSWAGRRALRQFWFPFNTPAARVDAFVHAPAAFRRRRIFVAAHDVDVA